MEKRIGVIGIVIENARESALEVNAILGRFSDVIIGRMGIPAKMSRDVSVISLIVEITTEQLGSLTGKLGGLRGVTVKSALTGTKK